MADQRTEYEVREVDGRLIATHVRIDKLDGKKTFWWIRDGQPGLQGLPVRDLPLYGAHKLKGGNPNAKVYLVEGERAQEALDSLGVVALGTVTGASGTPSTKNLEVLGSRHVILWPDADDVGHSHMRRIGTLVSDSCEKVSWFEPRGLSDKGDAFDWISERSGNGKCAAEIRRELESAAGQAPPWQPEPIKKRDQQKQEKRQPAQSELLVDLAADVELFHTPDGEACATVQVHDHQETHAVRQKPFRDWLVRRFYEREKKPPTAQALQDALGVLGAKAIFDGEIRRVDLRLAGRDDHIYLDLCNDRWEVVKITAEGWSVGAATAVKFRRTKGMLALPCPRRGGSIAELRRFTNVKTERDFVLIVAALVAALKPSGPYPILNFIGEQGSAKSSLQRFLRALIDPSIAPLRAAPKNGHDLVIAAKNSWMLVFDNLSGLSGVLSDALCRLATGGGFSTRKLYTDDEESLFDVQRPVMVNGINDTVLRGDLLDRAITVSLPPIPENDRRTERELNAEFERARPLILAGLLDAASAALRDTSKVKLEQMPRMADFAEWVVAAEASLPWRKGVFIEAYAENRDTAVETALESDPVAVAIRSLIEQETSFVGSMTELLTALEGRVNHGLKESRTWPRSAKSLSNRVRRAAPFLRSSGIEFDDLPREGRRRLCRLERVESRAQEGGSNSDGGDATGGVVETTVTSEPPTGTGVCDGSDGSDGREPTYSASGEGGYGVSLLDDDDEEVAV